MEKTDILEEIDNDPLTAIYKNDDDSWSTASEISDVTLRKQILGS